MQRLTLFITLIFSGISFAQIHEVGLYLGGTNAIADVGAAKYINPNDIAFGGIYKWNRSPRHSYRFTAIYANIKDDDANSSDPRRKIRNLSFENTIKELSAGLEFTFWDFDLHDKHHSFVKTTPYLYTGISYFQYDALVLENGSIEKYNTHSTFAIPMSLGIKTSLSRRFILAFEISARYSFTDDLDGSNPVRDKEEFESLKFGNINSNDWYVFTGFTLTYTFGENPCFCKYE
ncbi:type IX secretion system protein PorG [Pseudofulvibacter geojedonensis]|uniref:DUF6089 family protein n=1 Tax=Pseudofulvibacter geojedonensis TaxID=1123758 RepID=A0ABW3I689_9FLAO